MKEYVAFNLNEIVKVRLNEKGYQRLADLHNEFVGIIKSYSLRDAQFYANAADVDGYTKFQGWDFMNKFGPVMMLGRSPCFEMNILIES